MSDFVLGNMAWNAVLIGALAFMVRKWMTSMETKVTDYCKQNREDHKTLFDKTAGHDHRITVLEVKSEA